MTILCSAPAVNISSETPTASAEPISDVLSGKVIFLDPGHQGYATSAMLSRLVNNGRGGKKSCQTMGATSIHRVPEHTVNWELSQIIKHQLENLGARVILSRPDDKSWGGCITDRAEAANKSHADAAVSIHADSSRIGVDNAHRGFHLIVPTLPIANPTVNRVQSGAGLALSSMIRDCMKFAGIPITNYIHTANGLSRRSDIAGPLLTTVPLAFVEAGNLSNPVDAYQLESYDGQKRYADAITAGLSNFLLSSRSSQH